MKDAISNRITFHDYEKTIVAAAFGNDVTMSLHRARARLEVAQNPDIVRRKRNELRQPAGKRKCAWNRRRRRCASHLEPPVRSQHLFRCRNVTGALFPSQTPWQRELSIHHK